MQLHRASRSWIRPFVLLLAGLLCAGQAAAGPDSLPQTQAARLWEQLGSADEETVAKTVRAWVQAPNAEAALLALVRQDHQVDQKKVGSLVAQLDSAEWEDRAMATRQLKDMGPIAAGLCEQALQRTDSLEVRARLEEVIEASKSFRRSEQASLRYRRLGEVLVMLDSVEAWKVAGEVGRLSPVASERELFEQAVRPKIAQTLLDRYRADAMKALQQGQFSKARSAAETAKTLAEGTYGVDPAVHQSLQEYITYRHELAGQLKELQADGEAEKLLVVVLGELGDTARARQMLADNRTLPRKYALMVAAADQASGRRWADRARAWQDLLDSRKWTPWARARILARVRDAWKHARRAAGEDAELAKRATEAYNQADQEIAAIGGPAAVLGIRAEGQELSAEELARNVQPAEFKQTVPDAGKGAQWLTPTTWRVLGPLPTEVPDGAPARPDKTPGQRIDARQTHPDGNGKPVAWRTVKGGTPVDPGDAKSCYQYLYTEVLHQGGQPRTAKAIFGCDDTAICYVNGTKVFESDRNGKSWNPSQATGSIELKPGINRILVRLENFGGSAGFSIAFAGPAKTKQ